MYVICIESCDGTSCADLLQTSDQYTEDIDRADVVFVDDYCFMISHTGQIHGGTFADRFDPWLELEKAYAKLVSWPR